MLLSVAYFKIIPCVCYLVEEVTSIIIVTISRFLRLLRLIMLRHQGAAIALVAPHTGQHVPVIILVYCPNLKVFYIPFAQMS